MNKLLLLLGLVLPAIGPARAQTRPEAFAGLAALLAKANGRTYVDATGHQPQIIQQTFTERRVVLTEKEAGTAWTKKYTAIPWEEMQEFDVDSTEADPRFAMLLLIFKQKFPLQYTSGTAKPIADSDDTLELLLLSADIAPARRYLRILATPE